MKRALTVLALVFLPLRLYGQAASPSPSQHLVPYAAVGDNELQTLQKLLNATRANIHAVTVTPNDSTDLAHPGFLWVGGAGNVVVNTAGGETSATINSVAAGTLLPLVVTRVRTATTATNMLIFY